MERRSLATRTEVAEYLGVPVATLAKWATEGAGPRYRHVGRHTRYRWEDVEHWLDEQAQGGGAPAACSPTVTAHARH